MSSLFLLNFEYIFYSNLIMISHQFWWQMLIKADPNILMKCDHMFQSDFNIHSPQISSYIPIKSYHILPHKCSHLSWDMLMKSDHIFRSNLTRFVHELWSYILIKSDHVFASNLIMLFDQIWSSVLMKVESIF